MRAARREAEARTRLLEAKARYYETLRLLALLVVPAAVVSAFVHPELGVDVVLRVLEVVGGFGG